MPCIADTKSYDGEEKKAWLCNYLQDTPGKKSFSGYYDYMIFVNSKKEDGWNKIDQRFLEKLPVNFMVNFTIL